MINPAAPEGAPPRRINDGNVLKSPCPTVPRRGPEAGNHRTIMDFHASGVNSRSCAFQQSPFLLILPSCNCHKSHNIVLNVMNQRNGDIYRYPPGMREKHNRDTFVPLFFSICKAGQGNFPEFRGNILCNIISNKGVFTNIRN